MCEVWGRSRVGNDEMIGGEKWWGNLKKDTQVKNRSVDLLLGQFLVFIATKTKSSWGASRIALESKEPKGISPSQRLCNVLPCPFFFSFCFYLSRHPPPRAHLLPLSMHVPLQNTLPSLPPFPLRQRVSIPPPQTSFSSSHSSSPPLLYRRNVRAKFSNFRIWY